MDEAIGDVFGVGAIREDVEVAGVIVLDLDFVDVGDRVGQVVRTVVGRLTGIAVGVRVDLEPVAEAVEDPGRKTVNRQLIFFSESCKQAFGWSRSGRNLVACPRFSPVFQLASSGAVPRSPRFSRLSREDHWTEYKMPFIPTKYTTWSAGTGGVIRPFVRKLHNGAPSLAETA